MHYCVIYKLRHFLSLHLLMYKGRWGNCHMWNHALWQLHPAVDLANCYIRFQKVQGHEGSVGKESEVMTGGDIEGGEAPMIEVVTQESVNIGNSIH